MTRRGKDNKYFKRGKNLAIRDVDSEGKGPNPILLGVFGLMLFGLITRALSQIHTSSFRSSRDWSPFRIEEREDGVCMIFPWFDEAQSFFLSWTRDSGIHSFIHHFCRFGMDHAVVATEEWETVSWYYQ